MRKLISDEGDPRTSMIAFRTVEPFVPREKAGAWLVESIGVVLGLAAVGSVLLHPEPLPVWLFEFGLAIGAPTLLVYSGYRLGTSDLSPTAQLGIALSTVIGVVLAGLLGSLLLFHQRIEGGLIVEPGYFLLVLTAAGALTGFLGAAHAAGRSEPTPAEPLDSAGFEDDPLGSGASLDELTRRWLSETVVDDADYERLLVLQYLRRHPNSAFTPGDLADHLLDAEASGVHRALRRERLRLRLHHVHLPKLADAGLVSYHPPVIQYAPATDRGSP
jgi:hypothetical protein